MESVKTDKQRADEYRRHIENAVEDFKNARGFADAFGNSSAYLIAHRAVQRLEGIIEAVENE